MSVLDLAGRWRRGLDGSYVYLARATHHQDGTPGPVKIGSTTDPIHHLDRLQLGTPDELAYVALLPGGQAHKGYLQRRFADARKRGDWFEPAEAIVELVDRLHQFAEQTIARDPRQAMVDAIRTVDKDIAALERLWLNGATYQQITEVSGLPQPKVRRWLDAMRAMGFVLPHRYQFTSRDREAYGESGIIVARRRRAA